MYILTLCTSVAIVIGCKLITLLTVIVINLELRILHRYIIDSNKLHSCNCRYIILQLHMYN